MAGDPRLVALAYAAACDMLKAQDATLTNIRNRANGMLAAGALLTSLGSTLGVLVAEDNQASALPTWSVWSLFGVLLVLGGVTFAIQWPTGDWTFGAGAPEILEKFDTGSSEVGVRRYVTEEMIKGGARNDEHLGWRVTAYRASICLLLAEAVILTLAIQLSR